MKISEIFKSIQGEGINTGKDVVFLRTALCNLKCSWCDTKYTWDWDNYDYSKEVKELSINQVKDEIEQFNIKHLVITGGEPMMQADDLVELLSFLKPDFYVEVETNGTIVPKKMLTDLVDQWNVSPKTSNSNNPLEMCEDSECYTFFSNRENCFFKFVVENKSDIDEITKLVKKYSISNEQVLLMPQAQTKEELSTIEGSIASLANSNNLGFSSRLHVKLWGTQRGK